ncbi:MAG: iron-containing alcohol dehydrogenase [Nitratireductor sp.]|nr:iron-containing alcohol dehydrogenase [Nitratireductor sp.]MCC0020258.1 iron-containing alcohol dehydrogenase [Nitratireductor sp.]
MSLISFNWRVHFADGVLEEAIGSEIDMRGLGAPLLVSEAEMLTSELADRIRYSLPPRIRASECFPVLDANAPVEIATALQQGSFDTVIAFGPARMLVAAQEAVRYSGQKSGRKIALLAVPGLEGLPASWSASSGSKNAGAVASAIVCDPTVTFGIAPRMTASAGIDILAQCLEACFSCHYNPPADGIAIEGLTRVINALPKLMDADSLDLRREIMAASLSASLAQTKGPGPSQRLCDALCEATGRRVDRGSVKAIALPGIVAFLEHELDMDKRRQLTGLFPDAEKGSLAACLDSFIRDLPLPRNFPEIGISTGELFLAVDRLAQSGIQTDCYAHLQAIPEPKQRQN